MKFLGVLAGLGAMAAGLAAQTSNLPPAATQPAKAPAKIGAMPLRPTGGNSADVTRKPKDEFEAFDLGLEEANRRLGNR